MCGIREIFICQIVRRRSNRLSHLGLCLTSFSTMKTTFLIAGLLLSALSLSAAEKTAAAKPPMPQRVAEFTAKYDTEEKVTQRLAAWSKEEPNSPEPYVLAANAYLKLSSQVNINAGKNAPGNFAIVDPKTNKTVGAISEGPSLKGYQMALATLTTAAQKFPLRLDIHVGRMSVAKSAGDATGLLAAGQDMVKAAQAEGNNMRWLDDAPLPMPLAQKIPDELQGRIAWLYQQEKDETDKAAYTLSLEGLKISPDSFLLLNDAAIYHLYKKEWTEAKPYLQRAVKANPKDLYVKHNLARVFMELGEKDQARALWKEIYKTSPKSEEGQAAKKALDETGKK